MITRHGENFELGHKRCLTIQTSYTPQKRHIRPFHTYHDRRLTKTNIRLKNKKSSEEELIAFGEACPKTQQEQ